MFPMSPLVTEGTMDGSGPILTENMRNRLITECLLKVNDRKVNLGEALAESRQTIGMLAKTTSTLVRVMLAARRRKWREVGKLLGLGGSATKHLSGKTFSDQWLSLQFGWMPLVNDIYGLGQQLQDGFRKDNFLIRAVRQLQDTASYKSTQSILNDDVIGTIDLRYRCILWYRVSNADLQALSQMGLINPFEVAWAISPFSFLVDWLIPVGNVLEASTATLGLTFTDGVFSLRGDVNVSAECKNWTWPIPLAGHQNFRFKGYAFGFRRIAITSSPIPMLYMKSPLSSDRKSVV